jgi:hypothetical protein
MTNRENAGAAFAVGGIDGDVQSHVAHHLVAAAKPAGVAQLGPDGRRGDGANPVVVVHDRPAGGGPGPAATGRSSPIQRPARRSGPGQRSGSGGWPAAAALAPASREWPLPAAPGWAAAWMRCCQAVRWSTRALRSRTMVRRSRIHAGGIRNEAADPAPAARAAAAHRYGRPWPAAWGRASLRSRPARPDGRPTGRLEFLDHKPLTGLLIALAGPALGRCRVQPRRWRRITQT